MSLISESYHNEKLKKHNINIKTKYIVGNKILEKKKSLKRRRIVFRLKINMNYLY